MSTSEIKTRDTALEEEVRDHNTVWAKTICGIETKVIGASHIFNKNHIGQIEALSF